MSGRRLQRKIQSLHARIVGRCMLWAAERGITIESYEPPEKWPKPAQNCYEEELTKLKSK